MNRSSESAGFPTGEARGRRDVPGRLAAASLLALILAACADRSPVSPDASATRADVRLNTPAAELRRLAAERGITPMPPAPRVRGSLVRLGRMLVFDKELSGNRDISCMTCHHPTLGTGDARSLAIGQGAAGIGTGRVHPTGAFIGRNAPPLYNLHLLDHLFWDGRVSSDGAGFVHTPVDAHLTSGMRAVFEFGPLSAVGLLPVLSREEMRGDPGQNEIADLADEGPAEIWQALMDRLGRISAYRRMFEVAYPGTQFDEMSFAHASNAIAGFLVGALVFDNSPWDRFLAGSDPALTPDQLEGALKFMNAPCSVCHIGPGFSDDAFHNVALAQFGPGVGNGPSGRDDFGRMNVTGGPEDIYAFRTTMLRNVELTGPYGHAGQFADLEEFIDHYSESADKLRAYGVTAIPEALLRGTLLEDNKEAIIATRDPVILPAVFDAEFTRQVTAYMHALTDARARNLDRLIPKEVPSGLAVDR